MESGRVKNGWVQDRRVTDVTRRPGLRRGGVAAICLAAAMLLAQPALAEGEYDAPDAGNPVRISAYVLHPVGVIYDYLILRPAWWVGSHEPFRTMFGRGD